MERPLLNDPELFPSDKVLENIMGESYATYETLVKTVKDNPYSLELQWNYYRDGKAWLCKVSFKKKTIFWISVWDQYFKIGFYFVERTRAGVESLDIKKEIIEDFKTRKPNGKFLPLGIEMRKKEQIQDVLKIVEYKKNLK